MDEQVLQQTPLQNLFQYLQALYSRPKDYYDFSKEDGTKRRYKEFQTWQDLGELRKACQKEKLQGFELATDSPEAIQDFLLKIKRQQVPALPDIPEEYKPWLEVNFYAQEPVKLLKESKIKEFFGDSKQRVQAFEQYVEERKELALDPPPILKEWVLLDEEGQVSYKEELEVLVRLEEIPHLQKELQKLQKDIESYCKKYKTPILVNELYDYFHSLNYSLKGKDEQRLHLSFGLVTGTIGPEKYRNFLFHVPLSLQLRKQELRLSVDSFANKIFCEQNFGNLLEAHFRGRSLEELEHIRREIQEASNAFNIGSHEFDFDAENIRSFYLDTALQLIAPFAKQELKLFDELGQLILDYDDEVPEEGLRLSFSPIIHIKSVEAYESVARDAQNIKQKIDNLQQSNELHLIPDFFKKLFSVRRPGLAEELPTEMRESPVLSSRYFFPLAYNDEQFEIARRLDVQDALTVKGPPGTGKSHTIANIISHNVAQGKSILVISQNSKALSVVRDKLPESIQDLAVSLAEEGKGNEGLKKAVQAIIHHLAQSYSKEEAEQLEQELRALETEQERILERIYMSLRANEQMQRFYCPQAQEWQNKSASAWAEFRREEQIALAKKLIPESIAPDRDILALSQELFLLLQYARVLSAEEFGLGQYIFLKEDELPDTSELQQLQESLTQVQSLIEPKEFAGISASAFDAAFQEQLQAFHKALAALDAQPLAKSLFAQSNFDFALFENLLKEYAPLRQELSELERQLLSYQVDLSPLQGEPEALEQDAKDFAERFGGSSSMGFLKKLTLPGKLKAFWDCSVNGMKVSNPEQLAIVQSEIRRRLCLKRLAITFGNYLQKFGLSLSASVKESLQELDSILALYSSQDALNELLKARQLKALRLRESSFAQDLAFLDRLEAFSKYQALRNRLAELQQGLRKQEQAHPLLHRMADAIQQADYQGYIELLGEYRRLRERQDEALLYDEKEAELLLLLPRNIEQIKALAMQGQCPDYSKEEILADLFSMQLDNFLQTILAQTQGASKLLEQLNILRKQTEKKVEEIISYEAWMHKASQVSDTQKGALNAWVNDISNYGKGTGRNAARNMASAVRNMQIAKNAVPIWIMPIQKALDFFPDPSPQQFDLLIIDEASQCDISCLNLVFRAKKCLIVGDENQTSVTVNSRIFSMERTNELLDRYLLTHDFKSQFNVNARNNSIYTMSGVIYPNIVSLTEHFRCLPEIIGFSNRHIYGESIVPLKTALSKEWGEPVEIHYVEEDTKSEEKALIVKKLIACIRGFIEDYQSKRISKLPTVGVLSLDSSNAKHRRRILSELAKDELIQQYEDELDLLIGTAREFQGDERNVMILTIAASHRMHEGKAGISIRPPHALTSEEYMRIFNVAASRAKDKSILIHSIHPEAVALMNPGCYRRRLIDYYNEQQNRCRQPKERDLRSLLERVDPASGPFEREVCQFFFEQGLGSVLEPQFQVGRYTIDFAIIREGRKLAIECDGYRYHSRSEHIERDVRRQLILERAGWTFFRIQSTDWFSKPEQVQEAFLKWLQEQEA